MKKLTTSFSFGLFLLLVGSQSALAQGQATAEGMLLRWKFEQGKKFDVVIKQSTNQAMKMPTQELNVSNNMTTTMTWVIESVSDEGIASMVQTISRVQMDVDSPQGKMSYDSDAKEEAENAAQMAAIFKPMIGIAIRQTMNDRGEILDVEFPPEALKGVQSVPAAAAMMTPEALKEMTTKASPVLPDSPAIVGQTWSKEGASKTPVGAVSIKNTYTYRGQSPDDAGVELIDVEMEMDFAGGEDENPMMPKINVTEQDNKGSLTFNNSAGYLTASELNQDMTLQIQAGGQAIDQHIVSKTNMTVSPAK